MEKSGDYLISIFGVILALGACMGTPSATPTGTNVSSATLTPTPMPTITATSKPMTTSARHPPTPMVTVTSAPPPPPATDLLTPAVPDTVPSQACLLSDLSIISESLWDLRHFTWSSTGNALAYVGPNEPSDSLAGPLMLIGGPRFDTSRMLAQSAIGDPSWSPDGSRIAFVDRRSSDELGTVMLVDVDGSDLLDLLPGDMAHTDPGLSFKAIRFWWDEDRLVIERNCGTGCRQPLRVDLPAGTIAPFFTLEELGAMGVGYDWSPDRSRIIVTSGANPQIGVHRRDEEAGFWLSGLGASNPAWASFWTFFSDWAPDSARFLFLRQPDDASEPPQLWVWHEETQERTPVLPGVVAAAWSPQGEQIAFLALGQPRVTSDGSWQGVAATPEGSNPLGVGIMRWPEANIVTFLQIGDVDSYHYRPRTTPPVAPVWSADGRHVAYYDGTEKAGILHLTEDDVVHYELSSDEAPGHMRVTNEVQWSPEGRKLALRTADRLQIFGVPCQP